MHNPRIEAVRLLTKIEKEASYSSLAIKDALSSLSFEDKRDTAFTVSLVYGVLENKITIDYNISLYLNSSLSKLKDNVLNILRVGAYQLLYLDKIPASAAVNEAVKASKKCGASFASGMINAVLRKISANGVRLPDMNDKCYLSVKYSVDGSIIDNMLGDYGEEKTVEALEAFSGRRPIYIRVNTLKCTDDELISFLSSEGVNVNKTNLEHCLCVENTGDISALSAFKDGWFYVQDMSSQLCCSLSGAKPGDTVLDCCAAPGGKSFSIAQRLNNEGAVISCDLYEHKTRLISLSAEKLGITNLNTVCCDARELHKKVENADVVICDVPCSGFGVMGRKPEIRYKNMNELSDIPVIQKEILYSCCNIVREGGTLIYSTCTLNKNENDRICDEFLETHPDFHISDDKEYLSHTDRYITVFPSADGGDGFFIAKFIRGNS